MDASYVDVEEASLIKTFHWEQYPQYVGTYEQLEIWYGINQFNFLIRIISVIYICWNIAIQSRNIVYHRSNQFRLLIIFRDLVMCFFPVFSSSIVVFTIEYYRCRSINERYMYVRSWYIWMSICRLHITHFCTYIAMFIHSVKFMHQRKFPTCDTTALISIRLVNWFVVSNIWYSTTDRYSPVAKFVGSLMAYILTIWKSFV